MFTNTKEKITLLQYLDNAETIYYFQRKLCIFLGNIQSSYDV